MRHLLASWAALLLLTHGATAQITGTWATQEGETGGYAVVEIAPCPDGTGNICGTITDIVNNDNRSSVGRAIIIDMEDRGRGRYRGGQIYAPDQDRWYVARMNLQGDGTLEVYGCLAIGWPCRGQTWTRP